MEKLFNAFLFVTLVAKRAGRLPIFAAVLIVAGAMFAASEAFANDSTAREGAGGIEFLVNEDIRILEEVLEISPSRVRLKYRFFNEADRDIQTKVAFPIPFHDPVAHSNVSIGDPNSISARFTVFVNGVEIPTNHVRRAFVDGLDITDELRKLGLSDKEIFFEGDISEFPALMDRLEGVRAKFGDWWGVDQTKVWDMTFPAKKEIIVEHQYSPATGGGYAVPYEREFAQSLKGNLDKLGSSFSGKNDKGNEDCLDDTTLQVIKNRVKQAASKGAESVTVSYDSVEYILGTGRNWKGAIGEFRLRLVKDKPDQLVSVCFPGKPKKVSPTVYEFCEKDYVPQDKLVVYFYTVEPKGIGER